MEIINNEDFIRIKADAGFKLTNLDNSLICDDLCLGCNDSIDNYKEIPQWEANEIQYNKQENSIT